MENNNMYTSVIKALSAAVEMLLFGCIAINAWDVFSNENGVLNYIQPIVLTITSILGMFYVISGCKKGNGSTFLKGYLNLYALAILTSLLNFNNLHIVHLILVVIAFGLLVVLSCVQNLGKKKSSIISIVNLVVFTGCTFFVALTETETFIITRVAVLLMLAVATVFIILAKYQDKASRGAV